MVSMLEEITILGKRLCVYVCVYVSVCFIAKLQALELNFNWRKIQFLSRLIIFLREGYNAGNLKPPGKNVEPSVFNRVWSFSWRIQITKIKEINDL